MKFFAMIVYGMKTNHPDYNRVSKEQRELDSFSDIYSFDNKIYNNSDYDAIKSYVKNDLMLIAGGGYSTNTIKVYDFTIKKIMEA